MKRFLSLFLFIFLCFIFAKNTLFADTEENSMPSIVPNKTGYENIERQNATSYPDSAYNNSPVYFTDFSVFVREKAVVITWKASEKNRTVILYRSTKSFSSFISLTDAIPIADITDMGLPYIDYPPAGIPYYYAVAEEHQISSGNVQFIDGKNTAGVPAEVLYSGNNADADTALFESRPIPLPFLNLAKADKKRVLFFSSQTENIINALTVGKRDYKEFVLSPVKREHYIFSDDKKTPEGGETMELQRILKEYFLPHRWQQCEKELADFLLIKRTSRVTARALFYIGEALFFQNKYETALLKFLTAQDMYPMQSAEWAQYCLAELANFSKQRK